MILIDTGALFALQNRRDANHRAAVACYEKHQAETFAIHGLILAEAWYLCEDRLGTEAARKVAASVAAGELELLPTEPEDVTIRSRMAFDRGAARRVLPCYSVGTNTATTRHAIGTANEATVTSPVHAGLGSVRSGVAPKGSSSTGST